MKLPFDGDTDALASHMRALDAGEAGAAADDQAATVRALCSLAAYLWQQLDALHDEA